MCGIRGLAKIDLVFFHAEQCSFWRESVTMLVILTEYL